MTILKSRKLAALWLQMWVILVFCGLQSLAADRPSLEKVLVPLDGADQIAKAFKETSLQTDLSSQLLKKNRGQLQQAMELFNAHASFSRGEIENEKTLNNLMTYLQLSCLQIRLAMKNADFAEATNVLRSWFQFATDLPFEEASLISLRTSAVIRSLLLDELEKFYQQKNLLKGHEQLQTWLQQISAPWPVDRVLVGESKRHVGKNSMAAAENLARQIQKNPYQSAKSLLTKKLVKDDQDRSFLEQLWRDSDIVSMREEITRIGILQTISAAHEFERQKKQAPQSMKDLVDAGLILRVPLNYNTGRELQLSEAVLPSAAKH